MRSFTVYILIALLTPGVLVGQDRDPQAPDAVPIVESDTISTDEQPDDDRDGMRPYDEVIPADADSDEGVFAVHRVDEDFFFEIPLDVMDREFLLQTRITKTATGVGHGGERESMAVVRWERRGDRVLLRLVGHQNVAPDTLPIFEAVRNSNFEPILFAFDIETIPSDSSAVVIEVSEFFKADTPVIGLRSGRREEFGIRSLSRDRTFIESINSFPQNVEVRRTVTYTANDTPIQDVGGTLSMELGHSFLVLPDVLMEARQRDERVGYFSVRQNDFGTDAQRLVQRRIIQRWRLEPMDPDAYLRGELVEPVKPIVFYIDPATPEEWRPYLRQGVEDWREAFEQAGFRNAILARDPPTAEEDPEFRSGRCSILGHSVPRLGRRECQRPQLLRPPDRRDPGCAHPVAPQRPEPGQKLVLCADGSREPRGERGQLRGGSDGPAPPKCGLSRSGPHARTPPQHEGALSGPRGLAPDSLGLREWDVVLDHGLCALQLCSAAR